jgi:predicted lipid-binding transport protein (Tim44 family)
MNAWRPACVVWLMPGSDDLYANSPRRDAWRAQLLHDQVREEMAKRRNAAAMRGAIAAGVIIGVFGSFATYLI